MCKIDFTLKDYWDKWKGLWRTNITKLITMILIYKKYEVTINHFISTSCLVFEPSLYLKISDKLDNFHFFSTKILNNFNEKNENKVELHYSHTTDISHKHTTRKPTYIFIFLQFLFYPYYDSFQFLCFLFWTTYYYVFLSSNRSIWW